MIAYLGKLPQPASIRQIAHGMELKHSGRRFLPRVIQQLKRRGDIEETYGGRFRLAEQKPLPSPSSRRAARAAETAAAKSGAPAPPAASAPKRARDPNLIAGRIVAHRDGYGFVVPDQRPREDRRSFHRARRYRRRHARRSRAREHRAPHALTAARKAAWCRSSSARTLTVVGLFRYGSRGNTFCPTNRACPRKSSSRRATN